jgi:SAM-dependent methyltransferase
MVGDSVCPICGCPESRTITVRERRFALGSAFTYAVCRNCRLVRLLDPPPSMEPYYADYSYHRKSASGTPRSVSVAERLYRFLAGWLMGPLDRYVPRDRTLRVLDVGCARGDYLARLKASGFCELRGLEPSREAVENRRDRDLRIDCASLDAFETSERFDVITLNQVFEHCGNPRESLLKLKGLLRPGGRLVMSFPNYRSVARWLFGGYWPGYDAPRHCFCFSSGAIRLLAQQCGMKVQRLRYISRPSQFLGGLQYLWNQCSRHKQRLEDGFFRNSRVLDLGLYPAAYLLNLLRLGDMVEVHLAADEAISPPSEVVVTPRPGQRAA